jgi:hypothetical protein
MLEHVLFLCCWLFGLFSFDSKFLLEKILEKRIEIKKRKKRRKPPLEPG